MSITKKDGTIFAVKLAAHLLVYGIGFWLWKYRGNIHWGNVLVTATQALLIFPAWPRKYWSASLAVALVLVVITGVFLVG